MPRRRPRPHPAPPRPALTSVPTSRSRFICFVIGTSDFFLHLPSLPPSQTCPLCRSFAPPPSLPCAARQINICYHLWLRFVACPTDTFVYSCFIADIFHVAVLHLSDRQMSQFQMTRARATYPSPPDRGREGGGATCTLKFRTSVDCGFTIDKRRDLLRGERGS